MPEKPDPKTISVDTRVAREIASALKRNNIPYLFGIPGGGSSIDLIEACRTENIPFVLVQHESTAALMGIVCGQLTESCGACVSIMATGAINLASGTTYAYLERHPLLCITERYNTQNAPLMSLQKINHTETFAPHCKDTITLDAEDPGHQIDNIIGLAMAERPGPVHVDYPINIDSFRSEDVRSGVQKKTPRHLPESKYNIDAIANAINHSAKPILIIGPVVIRDRVQNELLRLVDKLQCAVMVTSKARGAIPEDHPLYAGVMSGIYRTDTLEGCLVYKSDLIVAVGLDRMELLSPWRYPQPLITIDSIGVSNDEIVGEPSIIGTGPLSDLLDSLRCTIRDRQTWSPIEIQNYWDAALENIGAMSNELNAASVISHARGIAPRNTILTTEAGVYGRVNLYAWKVFEANTYFDSSGANTMGFSIPAGLAASLVRPEQKTISLVGDGGFLMRAGELETAARLNLALTIIIFDDGTLGMIRIKQRSKKYVREGVDIAQIDFVQLTESFGGVGWKVDTLKEFDLALRTALESDRLNVIDVRLDPNIYASHYKPIRGG